MQKMTSIWKWLWSHSMECDYGCKYTLKLEMKCISFTFEELWICYVLLRNRLWLSAISWFLNPKYLDIYRERKSFRILGSKLKLWLLYCISQVYTLEPWRTSYWCELDFDVCLVLDSDVLFWTWFLNIKFWCINFDVIKLKTWLWIVYWNEI